MVENDFNAGRFFEYQAQRVTDEIEGRITAGVDAFHAIESRAGMDIAQPKRIMVIDK